MTAAATVIGQMLTDAVHHHGAGRLEAAQALYQEVLQHDPRHPDALHLLGVVADQQNRHDEAVDLIRRAIAIAPGSAVFHGNLGTALLALGREEEAAAAYHRAIELDPAYAEGHLNLGNLRRRQGTSADALRHYRIAASLAPQNAAVRLALGNALLPDQAAEALPHLTAAVQADPGSAAARDAAATALRLTKKYSDALLQHKKAIALAPQEIRYRENQAITLLKIDHPDAYRDATQAFEAVLALEPDRVDSLIGIGSALVKRQMPLAALPYLDRAMALGCNRLEALINHSAALAYAGRLDEALGAAERAVQLAPDNCQVLTHLATVRQHSGDHEGALAEYEAALQASNRTPEMVTDAVFKRAMLLLSLGRLAEGWALYRSRVDAKHTHRNSQVFGRLLPAWDGVVRPEQRILVWGEQGVGDQVIYAGMLPQLQALGADFIFACEPRLLPLFQRSFPGMRLAVIGNDDNEGFRDCADVQIGVGELGRWLRPTLADFPPARPYLTPDPDAVALFRRRYEAYGKRRIVGLTWRSNNMIMGNYKSVPLLEWAPVLAHDDVLYVDLQYGDTREEREALRKQAGINILHDDSIDAMQDLDRFAAQAAAMDLVIGASNSGQHIAAAAGRPCWIALPGGLGRLWYWFTNHERSPWYPDVRLFRQPLGRSDDWTGTIARMARAMDLFLKDETR